MTHRHCPRCEKDLPEADWSHTDWAKGGWCRACRKTYMADRTPAYTKARAQARPPATPRPPRQCKARCGREPSTKTSRYCGACRLARHQAKRKPDADVTYSLAHQRVTRFRGRPGSHQCRICDSQPAEHWAYDHADPDERVGTTSRGKPAPYSTDPAHYRPLCRSCHTTFDLAHTRSKTI